MLGLRTVYIISTLGFAQSDALIAHVIHDFKVFTNGKDLSPLQYFRVNTFRLIVADLCCSTTADHWDT